MKTRLLSCVAALLPLLALAPARADEGTTESWFRVHVAGTYAGFDHQTVKTVAGDTPRIETVDHSEVHLVRMGQSMDIVQTSTTWETPDGALIKMESKAKQSAQVTTTVYTFSKGEVEIATHGIDGVRTTKAAVPEGLVGPAHIDRLTRALAGTTGKTVVATSYMPDVQAPVRSTIVSKGPEKVEMYDKHSLELTRLETKVAMLNGFVLPVGLTAWVDAKGEPIKQEVDAGGITFQIYRVADEATARAQGEKPAAQQPDVFVKTLVREKDPIPVPRHLQEAWITVRQRKPDNALPDLADAGHVVQAQEDGSVLVHAKRIVPPQDKQGTRPLASPSAELADALAASSMIQSDAPEIVALAKKVVGAETNAWKAACKLETWVLHNITKKDMSLAFASALEVCRDREGDCTEHAVLLAALCRAAGIPARVLLGAEFIGGVWGGHAWNDVWIDGTWYPLDATNGYGFVDPLHLPMTHATLKEGGASEMAKLAGGIGALDMDITAVVRDGRRIEVGDPALVTQTEGSYSNRVMGISFKAPEGWKIVPPGPAKMGIQQVLVRLEGKTAEGQTVHIDVVNEDAPSTWAPGAFAKRAKADPKRFTLESVDGRPALATQRQMSGGKEARMVLTVVDGGLWVFALDHPQAEAERKALGSMLQSVDFDVQ
jgi:transglutaminase-like putative cysteine protease